MDADDISEIDIEALLKAMQPPTLPRELHEKAPSLKAFVSGLDRIHSLSVLGGLQIFPDLQANTIRMDWAMRLVAANASGSKKLKRNEWQSFLNKQLGESGVNRLEDPIEDFFVAPVITSQGEFCIILSCWENASFHTEQLIEAFSQLPNSTTKDEVVTQVFALLTLSDAMIKRAGIARRISGSGEPFKDLELPSQRRIDQLSQFVWFSWSEIEQLVIDPLFLRPFILPIENASAIADQPIGNSLIDFKPLIISDDGILIAAPGAISTAIRGLLIHAATTNGMGRALQRHLNTQNAKAAKFAGLGDLVGAPDMPIGEQLVRQSVREISAGRYVHVLLAVDGFGRHAARSHSA